MTEEFKLWLYKNYPDKFIDIDLTLFYKLFEKQHKINCYCGHTTICDCQPLNAIEKAENDFIKSKIEEGEESGFVDKTRKK